MKNLKEIGTSGFEYETYFFGEGRGYAFLFPDSDYLIKKQTQD